MWLQTPVVVLQVTAIIQILGGKLEICGTQKGGFWKWKITSSNKGYLQKLGHWYWRINDLYHTNLPTGFWCWEHREFSDCALWINETQPKKWVTHNKATVRFSSSDPTLQHPSSEKLELTKYSLYHWYRPFHPWRGSYGSWWCRRPSYLSDQIQNIFSYARKKNAVSTNIYHTLKQIPTVWRLAKELQVKKNKKKQDSASIHVIDSWLIFGMAFNWNSDFQDN